MCRSVIPWTLETVEQTPVRKRFETFHGNRWARTLLNQSLQSLTVPARNRGVRMQAKAGNGGTAGTGQSLHALRIDLISGTSHAAAGARPEGHSSGYGGGIEARQPGLIAGERIGFFRIGVRSQPAAEEEFRNTFGQRR